MKKFTSKSQKVGEIGENVACRHILGLGFEIVDRNYTKKWGELDIVAEKGRLIHFIEVKSVFCKNLDEEFLMIRPEENLNTEKINRLKRTIQTYILEKKYNGEWQFDLMCVYLDTENKKAKIKILENLIL